MKQKAIHMAEKDKSDNWDKVCTMAPEGLKQMAKNVNGIFRAGFPAQSHVRCELILSTGERVEDAFVDLSRQYAAEGKQWRTENGEYIETYNVVAWKRRYAGT